MSIAFRLVSTVSIVFALAVAAHGSVTETFQQSYPLTANGTIHLTNVNGDIAIVAWDKNEVSLEAVKVASSEDGLALIDLKIEHTPVKLIIKAELRKKWKLWTLFNKCEVRFKLKVPVGVSLQKVDTVNSDITVAGVRGPVDLDTVNGSITATGLAADARLDSVNGSLSAEFASLDGVSEVKLDSVNGRASVTLPKGAGARIDADSVNGRVSIDQPIKLGKIRRHSFTGQMGTGGPDISIETVNGGIIIREG